MSNSNKFFNMDWKFWISFVLNIIFVSFAGFFNLYDPKGEINADTVNQVNVLEIKESVPGLKVLLNDTDLFEAKKNLTLQVIRVSNSGGIDIDTNRFDQNGFFGIKVSGGTILDAKIVNASSDYLNARVVPSLNSDSVKLAPFYFPRKEQFSLKLLLLHDSSSKPEVKFEGVLAGTNVLPITSSYEDTQKISFWSSLNQGSLIVHMARFAIYIVAIIAFALFIMFCVVLPFSMVSDKLAKDKKRKVVERFKAYFGKSDDKFKFVFDMFINGDAEDILTARHLIDQPILFDRLDTLDRFDEELSPEIEMILSESYLRHGKLFYASRIANEVRKHIDLLDEESVLIFKNLLNQFSDFLIKNGYSSVEEDHRIRKDLVKKARSSAPTKKHVDQKLLDAITEALPPQPWPKGTHKIVCEKLGITPSQLRRSIDILISQGVIMKQKDGKLYD